MLSVKTIDVSFYFTVHIYKGGKHTIAPITHLTGAIFLRHAWPVIFKLNKFIPVLYKIFKPSTLQSTALPTGQAVQLWIVLYLRSELCPYVDISAVDNNVTGKT